MSDMYQRNCTMFAERFPDILKSLKEAEVAISQVVQLDENLRDIPLSEGASLYGGDGREYGRSQVEKFLEQPKQIIYGLPSGPDAYDSLQLRRMHREFFRILENENAETLQIGAVGQTGFLFILGIGLGFHIKQLIENLSFSELILVEEYEEFMAASLHVVDWTEIFDICDQRNIQINIILGRGVESLYSRIKACYTRLSVLMDGSYITQHYGNWTYAELQRRIASNLPITMIGMGYFEDERKMLRNTVSCFHEYDFHILKNVRQTQKDCPVFICGAGPSLDNSMPYIKKWRDHVVVISCGSGLQPLLKAGVIPDIHVELENAYVIFEKLQHIMDANKELFPTGKFTGIQLICSSTINPNSLPFFEDIAFFWREASCSTLAFSKDAEYMAGGAPTVANTGLAVAAYLNFRECYFFGVDLGWREGVRVHHAKDTIYYTSKRFSGDDYPDLLTRKIVPANFGGVSGMTDVFEWSRIMLEQMLPQINVKVFNCSDGVLIKGSIPHLPEAVNFDHDPLDRAAIMAGIRSEMDRYEAKTFFRDVDFKHFRAEIQEYEERICPFIIQAIEENWSLVEFYRRFSSKDFQPEDGLNAIVRYASNTCFRFAAAIIQRVIDDEKRNRVTKCFYSLFLEFHQEMFKETLEHLDQAEAWTQHDGPRPKWADGLPEHPGTSY